MFTCQSTFYTVHITNLISHFGLVCVARCGRFSVLNKQRMESQTLEIQTLYLSFKYGQRTGVTSMQPCVFPALNAYEDIFVPQS